MNNLDLGLVLV